jgi:hypothetical protein
LFTTRPRLMLKILFMSHIGWRNSSVRIC